MSVTAEQQERVRRVIARVAQEESVDRDRAQGLVHRFVCQGKCGWYRREAERTGFKKGDITSAQKKTIQEATAQLMEDLTLEEAITQIHEVIC